MIDKAFLTFHSSSQFCGRHSVGKFRYAVDSPLTQVRVLFLIIDTDVCIEPESAGGGHCCIKRFDATTL